MSAEDVVIRGKNTIPDMERLRSGGSMNKADLVGFLSRTIGINDNKVLNEVIAELKPVLGADYDEAAFGTRIIPMYRFDFQLRILQALKTRPRLKSRGEKIDVLIEELKHRQAKRSA